MISRKMIQGFFNFENNSPRHNKGPMMLLYQTEVYVGGVIELQTFLSLSVWWLTITSRLQL